MPADTHDTLDECTDAEAFIPGPDQDSVVAEETLDEVHTQTVECPICGRRFDYVFDFEGVFDPDADRYVSAPDRFEEIAGAEYYDGLTFNRPIGTPGGRQLEQVWILTRLQHDGDVIHDF